MLRRSHGQNPLWLLTRDGSPRGWIPGSETSTFPSRRKLFAADDDGDDSTGLSGFPGLYTRNLRAFLSRLGQPDRNRLLAARHPAAAAALAAPKGTVPSPPHCRPDGLLRASSVSCHGFTSRR